MAKKQEEKMTRAQKTEATKGLIKELLATKLMRHNELIDEVSKLYVARYQGEETENVNDVKGRVGSVLDIMKKESEVMVDGGVYALKARLPMPPPVAETPAPKKRTRVKKAEPAPEEKQEEQAAEPVKEEKSAPKKRTRAKKVEPASEEKKEEAAQPVQEEKPAPKKRTRARKAEPVVEKEPAPAVEVKAEKQSTPVAEPAVEEKAEPAPIAEETKQLIVQPKAELAPMNAVMDMSFLLGNKVQKAAVKKEEEKRTEKPSAAPVKPAIAEKKAEEKKVAPAPAKKAEIKKAPAQEKKPVREQKKTTSRAKAADKPMTAEEKLCDAFLKRMRTLGGDYFEYYSVYLLERYSMKNGRRLEGLHISGGDHDGGIDGEIELTDKLGFKETIYIQSKNWDPEKGKEENWVVGETLLQQFIGACACRQAKDGKQNCRGIFITTSRFTPDAKKILDTMSDKIVGYDGNDLFETAKECEFGLIKKNGEWSLDEKLLSGSKAFFQMF